MSELQPQKKGPQSHWSAEQQPEAGCASLIAKSGLALRLVCRKTRSIGAIIDRLYSL